MKKRILQVNLDGTGGAFSLMYQLQKHLKSKYIFDYYWTGSFIRSTKSYELEKMGSRIYEDNLRKHKIIGHMLLPWHFYRFLKKNPYEIIHINADVAYKELLYAISARKAGVRKIIIHSHSSGVNGNYKYIKLILHKLCKPFLKNYGDEFLTCSNLASKWMFDDESKVVMINNGIDLKKYAFNPVIRKSVRNSLNLDLKTKVIGTIGNFSYQKNPFFLIDLLKEINSDSKYTLIFVGDGENKNRVEKYAKKLGVYDSCIFYGKTDSVSDLLNAMDIFLLPSRFEGLPVSAIEAQGNGLPCLLSKNITREVRVTPNCFFLSVNDINEWKTLIEKKYFSENREDAINFLKKNKFDIKDSARLLDNVYDR